MGWNGICAVSLGLVVHRLASSLCLHGKSGRGASSFGPGGGQHHEGRAGIPSSGQLRDSPLGVAAEETGQGAAWRRCRLRLVGGGMAPGAKVSAVGRAVITAVLGAGGQRAEDRGRRTEDRGQRTDHGQRTTDHGPACTDHRSLATDHWAKAVCRAGAVVLLVGFWFDGGLFKLATAAPFWILLEVGRDD